MTQPVAHQFDALERRRAEARATYEAQEAQREALRRRRPSGRPRVWTRDEILGAA